MCACSNLVTLDQAISDAVKTRQEVDLRIGEGKEEEKGGREMEEEEEEEEGDCLLFFLLNSLLIQAVHSLAFRQCVYARRSPTSWKVSWSAMAPASSLPSALSWRGWVAANLTPRPRLNGVRFEYKLGEGSWVMHIKQHLLSCCFVCSTSRSNHSSQRPSTKSKVSFSGDWL